MSASIPYTSSAAAAVRAEAGYRAHNPIVLDIAHAQAGPLLSEVSAKVMPHMSQSLNDDVEVLQGLVAVAEPSGRPDTLIDTEGCNR